MIKSNLFKSVLLMLFAVSAVHASEMPSVIQAPVGIQAPAQESFWKYVPGAAWGLVTNLYKASAYTVGAAVNTAGSAWNYFEPQGKANIAVGLSLIAARLAWTYKNSNELWTLQRKRDPEHPMYGNREQNITDFNSWRLKDVDDVNSNKDEIIRLLRHDYERGKIKIAHYPFKGALKEVPLITATPTWHEIQQEVERQKNEFHKDVKFIESKYVTYFDFKPYTYLYDAAGILNDINIKYHDKKVDGVIFNMKSPGSWTPAQRERIALDITQGELGRNKSWQYLFMPNYSLAVKTWWIIYKQWVRLDKLDRLIHERFIQHHQGNLRPFQQVVVNIPLVG